MIQISNDGPEIRSTTYWCTEHAAAGLCFLSGNAGALRLLVPEPSEKMLLEMRTGKRVYIESSIVAQGNWDIVFDDGTDTPFSITIDKKQVDRAMEAGHCILSVWTKRGKALEMPCDVLV